MLRTPSPGYLREYKSFGTTFHSFGQKWKECTGLGVAQIIPHLFTMSSWDNQIKPLFLTICLL